MLSKAAIILALALVGWALCGAIMGLGLAYLTLDTTIFLHAVGAPVVFGAIAWVYFCYFGYTTPLQTAAIFFAVALFMDVFVVALLIEKSFAMFASIAGVWLPMGLSFAATYIVGAMSRQTTTRVSSVSP